MYTWGNKSRGRLGNGDKDAASPCKIDIIAEGLNLIAVSSSNGGTLLAFGDDERR